MINLSANIKPWVGLGDIELYTHISQLKDVLDNEKSKPQMLGRFLIKYEIENKLILWFNIINGKLFKITACNKYTGILNNGIHIGMSIEDALNLDEELVYDEFEEVYESAKGIYLETDPITNQIKWISVFVPEISSELFEDGEW